MDLEKAYRKRDTLDRVQLERLLQQLRDQVDRYKVTIENYPPERMEKFGKPYLNRIVGRMNDVEELLR